MSMQLFLVAPGLLAQPPRALATAPSLAKLARFARAPRLALQGLAVALADAIGVPAASALAPLAALGAGIDPGQDYTLFADPVFLAADRDDLVLMQRIDDLAADDANRLAATLNGHFADDGLDFVLARPDAWFARCSGSPDVVTTPFDAAHRRGLYPHLPRGTDAGTWRRWENEIQMLLHEHPVNASREAEGKTPVTGVWFWGGGTLGAPGGWPAVAVTAGGGRIGDLARGLAAHGGGTHERPAAADTTRRVVDRLAAKPVSERPKVAVAVIVVDDIEREAAIAAFESHWLAPALALLERRAIESLELIADGNGIAARWTAPAPALWQRVFGGARAKAFTLPEPLAS